MSLPDRPQPSSLSTRPDGLISVEGQIVNRNPAKELVIGQVQQVTGLDAQIGVSVPAPRRGGINGRLVAIGGTVAAALGLVGLAGGVIASGGGDEGGQASVTFVDPSATPTSTKEPNPTAKAAETAAAVPTFAVKPGDEGAKAPVSVKTAEVPTNTPVPATVTPTEVKPTQVPSPTPRPTEAAPTATPTKEVVQATILDRAITPVTIDQLKNEAISAYDSNAQAFKETDGSIYPKQYFVNSLNYCEKGNPGLPEVAIEKNIMGECADIVRKMVALYRRNGDSVLLQIAVDARSNFVTRYPAMKSQFDAYLTQAGIK